MSSRHTLVEISTDYLLLLKLSGHEYRYFEEILNPQKSVCGTISTFLMLASLFSTKIK